MPSLKPCRYCGDPIYFTRNSAGTGWVPMNADGKRAHYETCSARRRSVRVPARTGQGRRAIGAAVTHIYRSDDPTLPPPWCESLGEFHDFTSEEIAAGNVCRPVELRASA